MKADFHVIDPRGVCRGRVASLPKAIAHQRAIPGAIIHPDPRRRAASVRLEDVGGACASWLRNPFVLAVAIERGPRWPERVILRASYE